MKHTRILALLLAVVLSLSAAAPTLAAGDGYFSDVEADAWYAEGVKWATDCGIVKGYPDGSFGVGRPCTFDEAIVMTWRAAGSKSVGDAKNDVDRAWAWLERQCGSFSGFLQGYETPIPRMYFVMMLYRAMTDPVDIPCELHFTDVDYGVFGEDKASFYEKAVRWIVAKGIMNGYTDTEFCPNAILTREQVVTALRRAYGSPLPYTVTKRAVPIDPTDPENDKIELVFLDGADQVPYIEIENAAALISTVSNSLGQALYQKAEFALDIEKAGDRVTLTRENGFSMILDFAVDTISFIDFDAFLRSTSDGSIMDLLTTSGFDAEGNPAYLQIRDSSSERYGVALTLDPGAYGLHFVRQGDEYYVPLQTVSDLFFAPRGLPLAYNGLGIYFAQPTTSAALESYYSVPTGERSDPLAMFAYKELCFFLDTMYGLSKQHDISSFTEEVQMIDGMTQALQGKDPAAADEALSRLTSFYLDDLHSGFNAPSYLEGAQKTWNVTYGASTNNMVQSMLRTAHAKLAAYPQGAPAYEEVGDTAFITFDSFTAGASKDYYKEAPDGTETDTFGIMLYAFSQITREGSPVKNVVLDLSNNGGGSVQTAAFVLGMFLGEGSISVKNTLTGALVTQNFRSDMNLDRVFDEKDELTGYNLYCLISPCSFSSGNLVPSVFKSSHKVTLLGQTSGGGSCAVMKGSTADGAFFQFSSPYCISFLKNGSFYDIDQGVAPDVYIRDMANFYDREVVAEIIHNLK